MSQTRIEFEGTVTENRRGLGYNSVTVADTQGKRFLFTVKSQQMREGWQVKGSGVDEREIYGGKIFLAQVRVRRQGR